MKPSLPDWSDDVKAGDLLAVIRLIESLDVERPRLGQSVKIDKEPLRLSQHVSLAFQGSELHALTENKGQHPLRLYCNFLGLMGTNGPLPLHYTEHAIERASHKNDPTFRDFIDLFNHRLLSLFYRSLSQHDPVINHDRPDQDIFTDVVSSIAGYHFPDARGRDRMPDHIKRWHAFVLGARSTSPDGLKALIEHYFDVRVAIKEFIGSWLALPIDALLVLKGRRGSASLGRSTVLGRRVWGTSHKFRLCIGPLNWDEYGSFKPGGERAHALHDFVRNYIGDELDWDVEFIVGDRQISALTLNCERALGFDSWLTGSRDKALPFQSVVVSRQFMISSDALN